jgi:glycogen(starch) synthase
MHQDRNDTLKSHVLLEIGWEVCNQVGGIFTVLRTKVPRVVENWGDDYVLIGPYLGSESLETFEECDPENEKLAACLHQLKEQGLNFYHGYWMVSGRPKVILLDIESIRKRLDTIKYYYYENYRIESHAVDPLYDQVLLFGEAVFLTIQQLKLYYKARGKKILAHYHEWMAAASLGFVRKYLTGIKTVFTTHATLLGRYLSNNDKYFYENLSKYNWKQEAAKYGILHRVQLESMAAQHAHLFTTVSGITARECRYLLERKPEMILPNGLNISRFSVLHEVHNVHQEFKEEIHQFVMAHFFRYYTFNLENTLYFFISGRLEYYNKGFDLLLEALKRLNKKMNIEEVDQNIVVFFITKSPIKGINADVLEARGVMEEVRQTVDKIQADIGKKLFYEVVSKSDSGVPSINNMIDEYWKLRLLRTLKSWRKKGDPPVTTHDLIELEKDQLLQGFRTVGLTNKASDKVKVIYHPDFINPMNPLFGIEYGQFVRGCHLGIFPSFYEPWGYTPLECLASGIPAITSDLAGFGDQVLKRIPDHQEFGIYVVNRKNERFENAASQLANILFSFVLKSRRDRINQRNRAEDVSENFSWKQLIGYYMDAYKRVVS